MKLFNYIVLSAILLFGCSDEIDQLDPNKIDKWEISNIEEEYRIQLNSILKVNPIINGEGFDKTKYDYVWYMYDHSSLLEDKSNDTLGVEMNLNCKIDNKVIKAIDTEHSLVFKMVDKETGVYYVHRSKLFASGVYGLGSMLLCEDDGKYQIHFIHRDSREMDENVCVVDEGDLTNPTKIAFIKPLNRYLPELKEIMVFCDNENGGVVLDPTTLTKKMSFREKVNSDEAGVMTPKFHFQNGSYDYLIYNGSSCRKVMSSSIYDPVFAVISQPGYADMAPMAWKVLQYWNADFNTYSSGGPIYYDQKNNRFLEHAVELRGYVKEMVKGENSAFDCNHVGDNMLFVCGGKLPGIGKGWALMRDGNTQKLYLLKFSTTMEFPIPGDKTQCVVTFTGTDKIELTSAYSSHLAQASYTSSVYDVEDGIFIFGTEDQVFAFNVNMASAGKIENLETELISTADLKGLKIKNLEYISYEKENPGKPFEPLIEKEIRLYTSDPDLGDKKYGVIFYKMETLGGLHAQEIFRKTGISDKIIDIEEKFD